jgi:TM2 domain-containing membrane protein YozV
MPTPALRPPTYAPLAALLSYLIPGLGQIYQGRIGKGILFLVCVYGLFFYGMSLGSWSNVYLPDSAGINRTSNTPRLLLNLYDRPQFLGQFWMGIVVWPGIWQYLMYDEKDSSGPLFGPFERTPYEWRENAVRDSNVPQTRPAPAEWRGKTLSELQTDGDKTWDLGWVYTVIAGVLNVMVIYDAYAGPAFSTAQNREANNPHAAPAPLAGR